MILYNREGKPVTADKDQIEILKKAGFTVEKPVTEKVTDSEPELAKSSAPRRRRTKVSQ